MSSTNRAYGMALVALTAMGVVGCQQKKSGPQVETLSDAPLVVDEAMQIRDWPLTTAHYANGDAVAGPNGQVIPMGETNSAWDRVVDPALGTANLVVVPFWSILNPPTKDVRYQGVILPPTYYAMPAIVSPEQFAVVVTPAPAPVETEVGEPVPPGEPVLEEVTPDEVIMQPEPVEAPVSEPKGDDDGEMVPQQVEPAPTDAMEPAPSEVEPTPLEPAPTSEELEQAIEMPEIEAPATDEPVEEMK